jgi:starch phosphorylase
MKAAANGGLNLSIADGWWPEGADGTNGWTIGAPAGGEDDEARDRADAESLYRLLEDEVLPLWTRRDEKGLAREWLLRARRALATIPPRFDAARMVAQYRDEAYAPLARRRLLLEADGHAGLVALAADRRRIREAFAHVRILEVGVGDPGEVEVGDGLDVHVKVDLGPLSPEDVHVELVLGLRANGAGGEALGDVHDLPEPRVVRLALDAAPDGSVRRYTGRHLFDKPGNYGYGVRVRPRSEDAGVSPLHEPALWA